MRVDCVVDAHDFDEEICHLCRLQKLTSAGVQLRTLRQKGSSEGNRSDESVGLLGVVPPGGREGLGVAVVAGESVDTGLDHDESELGVPVLSELLQVLSDLEGLLNQVVEVFGDLGGETRLFQDSEDFTSSDALDLGDAMAISESDANLRRGETLLRELDNLINEVVGRNSDPAWCSFSVWEASACDTLALRIHSTHFVFSATI